MPPNQSAETFKYSHEFFTRRVRHFKPQTTRADWEIFLDRIGFDLRDIPGKTNFDVKIMNDFQRHIFDNINWYERSMVKENMWRTIYIIASTVLLFLVPILVSWLNQKAVTAQVVGVFTGIFALYEGVSNWLAKRNVIGTYWQTSSNLKSRLFSLQDKWKYTGARGWTSEDVEELVQDIYDAVEFGLECQKVEKQIFFNNYSYPQFNVLTTILNTRNQVMQLLQPQVQNGQPADTSSLVTAPPLVAQLAKLTKEADQPTKDRTEKPEPDSIVETPVPLAVVPAPAIFTRKQWEAQPPKRAGEKLGLVKSIVIHHAAGYWPAGNEEGKGPEMVRKIQQLHQGNRRWSDIGYHFLIDPDGVIYQGRKFFDHRAFKDGPTLAKGAHVRFHNTGRIGICILGNYEPDSNNGSAHLLNDAIKTSLKQLVDFLIVTYKPIGDDQSIPAGKVIVGHRDLARTACPGSNVYPWLEALRVEVVV